MKVALSVFLRHLGKQKGRVLIFKLFYQKIRCFINLVPLLGDTETKLLHVATRICLYCTLVLPPRISSVIMRNSGATPKITILPTTSLCGELWLVERCGGSTTLPTPFHQPQLTRWASCGQSCGFKGGTRIFRLLLEINSTLMS